MQITDDLKIKGQVRYTLTDLNDNGLPIGKPFVSEWNDNLTPTVGINYIVSCIAGDVTRSMSWFTAMGISQLESNSAMWQLGNETSRYVVGSKEALANSVISARTLIDASAGSGTWYEVGLFVAASTGINSGIMLSRVTFPAGIIKTTRQTLTIDHQITLTAQ